MVRVVGIDPGTDSWGIIGLENEKIILDTSIPTKRILNKPSLLIEILNSMKKIDLLVAPSGHGLPNVPIQELSDRDLFLMTIKKKLSTRITGLGEIAKLLKENGFTGYFIPSVKLLSSVPTHRKINKIDMGTADKVCSTVLGVYDQSNRLNLEYSETSFILVEIGTGFTATIGVENGKIVDGIGGSLGCAGFQACGGLDGELAYLFDTIYKRTIYSGGASSVAGYPDLSPEEFLILAKTDEKFELAKNFLIEGILKDIYAMFVSVKTPKEILLSGRLAKLDEISLFLKQNLKFNLPVRRIQGLPDAHIAKEAAQGAAIIANGLAGGIFKPLIDTMDLLNARGNVLDQIYFKEIEKYK
ncbi:MAG: DUF1464 family protein [Candidatus Helarchaeota archaeon]